jgi:hypothetical protein
LLHIHIPKTGGTSLVHWIKALDPDAKKLCKRAHQPASYISENHPSEFANYYKFAIVRNPWARAVSLYHYRQISTELQPPHWPSRKEIDSLSFREVVLKSLERSPEEERVQWLEPSCYFWLNINDDIAVDHICKLESIQRDINLMCEKLEIKGPALPHKNKSKHAHYVKYYDDETRDIVARKYAKDIEHFGYTFGD